MGDLGPPQPPLAHRSPGGMGRARPGYRTPMSMRDEERPVDLGGVPAEEGINAADAEERLDVEPEEQVNRAERVGEDDLDLVPGKDDDRD